MSFSRLIVLKGKALDAGKEPLVCTPLGAVDEAAVDRELILKGG